ncbi:MAG: C1 family peptidase [Lewinellaceae bacterium]|nr:C1 family peptidase [Lewinellaceae bacterium]
MRRYYFLDFLFLLLLLPCSSLAQPSPDNGLLWEDEQYGESPMMAYYALSDRGGDIPAIKDFKAFCPTPQDQGNTASCVGYALAHGLTIARSIQKKWRGRTNIDAHAHSASFIYNQIKLDEDCESGAYLTAGLRLLQQQGDCLISDFKNTPGNCRTVPRPIHKQKASAYRIFQYKALFLPDATEKEKLDQVRTALANGQPPVIGMYVPINIKVVSPSQLDWSSSAPKSGHALVVIGYNEKERTFELLNSYGPAWGDGGFFKLPYDVLASHIRYGFCLELGEDFGCE